MPPFVRKLSYIQSGQPYKGILKVFLNYGYSHASELLLYSLLQQDSKNLGFKIYKEWLPHLFYILVPPQHNIKAELKKMKS